MPFAIVAGWSFFPLVPTDVICYVAGIAKMSFKKMVMALLFGEIPLVTTYIFLGVEIGEWLRTWTMRYPAKFDGLLTKA